MVILKNFGKISNFSLLDAVDNFAYIVVFDKPAQKVHIYGLSYELISTSDGSTDIIYQLKNEGTIQKCNKKNSSNKNRHKF